ncbi:AAA family ATPase [Aeromonas veronii]
MSMTLNEIALQLEATDKKVQLIYAFNGTGKTRLSREFKNLIAPKIDGEEEQQTDLANKKILYYSAFTEDLFYWDNDLLLDAEPKLIIQANSFTKWVLEAQGQGPAIIEYFQKLTNSNVEPEFSPDFTEVSFSKRGGENNTNIKISKGEESNFVWSVFYCFLDLVVEELSSAEDDRSTNEFNKIKYVFIDDPVTSLDDNHLIELAVDLAKLVKSSTADLKFIITTHNPLFYNVLSNEFSNKLAKEPKTNPVVWLYRPGNSMKFRLDKKTGEEFLLTELERKTPFSYHLFLLSEIRTAISDHQIMKYHFGFLRNILEKTATFLGHDSWENMLPKDTDGNPDPFLNRILNLSSHSAHAGEETGEVEEHDRAKLIELVDFLSSKYGFWKPGV